MIGRLRGTILEKQPPLVLIEVNGVGYDVYMPMTCFYELPELNHEVIIFTQFIVRGDTQLLYGFISKYERTLFRELIKANGVGPKLALAILSGMSAQQFITAVEREEVTTLIKLPGIGKKTAERLMIEMKHRFKSFKDINDNLFDGNTTFPLSRESEMLKNNDAENKAVAALITLGYKQQEASRMIRKISRPDTNCETLIREALRAAL